MDAADLLPADLLPSVLQHLACVGPAGVTALARVRQVTTLWRSAADDASLWRTLALRTYGKEKVLAFDASGSSLSCKRMFERASWTQSNWLSAQPQVVISKLDVHDGPPGWLITSLAEARGVVAAGGTDGTIRLWQLGSGRLLAALPGHTGSVSALVFSADGRSLFSGAWDKSVRAWDVLSRQCTHHLPDAHRRAILCLQVQGGTLISGGGDGRLVFWDLVHGFSRRSEREDWPVLALLNHVGIKHVSSALISQCRAAYVDGSIRQWDWPNDPSVTGESELQATHEELPPMATEAASPAPMQHLRRQPATCMSVLLPGRIVEASKDQVCCRPTSDGSAVVTSASWRWASEGHLLTCLKADERRTVVGAIRPADSRGVLLVLDAHGQLRHTHLLPSPVRAMVMTEERVLVGCRDGVVHVIEYALEDALEEPLAQNGTAGLQHCLTRIASQASTFRAGLARISGLPLARWVRLMLPGLLLGLVLLPVLVHLRSKAGLA